MSEEAPFRMYVWDQDFLTDWWSGIAVAVARNVDEARQVILAGCEKHELSQVERDLDSEPSKILDLPAAVHEWGTG